MNVDVSIPVDRISNISSPRMFTRPHKPEYKSYTTSATRRLAFRMTS